MITKIASLSKSKFVRNVATVATGTAGAQAISIAFSPIITRLYGPDSFGLLGVFMALVAVLAPLAALTYPIAIVLPKEDSDARALGWLSFYIAFSMSSFFAIVIVIWGELLLGLVGLEAIVAYSMLIPIAMFFSAILQIARQWLIRKKQFKVTAKVALYQALIISSNKTGLGFLNPIAFFLIIVSVAGSILQAIMLWAGIRKVQKNQQVKQKYSKTELKQIAIDHKDFPIYRAPQIFINAISQGLPVIMLASFFGPAAAGFYALSKTVLDMPIGLIGQSVSDVFYPRINEAAHNNENLTKLLTKATLVLSAVGIIPFGIVIAFGPWLFEFVFGQGWDKAGEYAVWLSIFLFFNFINKPTVAAVPILELQGGLLFYEVFSTGLKFISIMVGFFVFKDDLVSIMLFSISGAISYIFMICWILIKSKSRKTNE